MDDPKALVQSVKVPKKSWTPATFKTWLEKKKYKADEIVEEGDFLVVTIVPAEKFTSLRSKTVGSGIVFTFGIAGEPHPPKPKSFWSWLDEKPEDTVRKLFA